MRALNFDFPPPSIDIVRNFHLWPSASSRLQRRHCNQSEPLYQIVLSLTKTEFSDPTRFVAYCFSKSPASRFPLVPPFATGRDYFLGARAFSLAIFG